MNDLSTFVVLKTTTKKETREKTVREDSVQKHIISIVQTIEKEKEHPYQLNVPSYDKYWCTDLFVENKTTHSQAWQVLKAEEKWREYFL